MPSGGISDKSPTFHPCFFITPNIPGSEARRCSSVRASEGAGLSSGRFHSSKRANLVSVEAMEEVFVDCLARSRCSSCSKEGMAGGSRAFCTAAMSVFLLAMSFILAPCVIPAALRFAY